MLFTDEDIKEFHIEGLELLRQAEEGLLDLERGGLFQSCYDLVFRCFHSLKGGAALLQLQTLQTHVHKVEGILVSLKQKGSFSRQEVDFFLRAIDAARDIMSNREVSFKYEVEAVPATSSPLPTPPRASTPITKIGTAVIVDDEEPILSILGSYLEEAGFEPVSFLSPREALEYIKKNKVDLIFTDYKMPEMDGGKFSKEVATLSPDLPIIVISGFVSGTLVLNGLYALLEKPFDKKEIKQIALQAFKRYEAVKLLNRSIDLILYQLPDLDDYLKAQGKEDIRQTLRAEINRVIELRQQLRDIKRNDGP